MNPEEWKTNKIKGVLDAMNMVNSVQELETLAKNIIPSLVKGLPLEDIKYLRTMYLSRKQAIIEDGKPYDDSYLKDEYRKSVNEQAQKDSKKPKPKEDFYEEEEPEKKPKAVEKDNQMGQVNK